MYLVTGGRRDGYDFLDSTELYNPSLGKWVISTSTLSLPKPMAGLRAANINDRVMFFGINEDLIMIYTILQEHNNCRRLLQPI